MRARKTKINCEEDLFNDSTNYTTVSSHPRKKKKFAFEEQQDYKIDSLN
jgi:hypothetical protein